MLKENFNTFQNLHRSFKLRQMFCLGDQFRFNGWIQRRIKRQGFLDSVFCGSAEDINAVIDILQSMRQIQVDIISNQAGQKILSVAVATVCAFIIGVNILLIFVERVVQQFFGEKQFDIGMSGHRMVEQGANQRKFDQAFYEFALLFGI